MAFWLRSSVVSVLSSVTAGFSGHVPKTICHTYFWSPRGDPVLAQVARTGAGGIALLPPCAESLWDTIVSYELEY
ncbi:hypothetical protein BJ742DRAFT_813725 [Cladochytrium replicatum]|nr:hypothetical protein BJ742DRAFT_813725 [Cladochytrium replicatum]